MIKAFKKVTNTHQISMGLFCAIVCLFVPILSRTPKGLDWVIHYMPQSMDGFFTWLVLALIPPAVVFLSSLIAKPRFYLPLALAFLTAVISSAYYHHDYDLSPATLAASNLAGIGLVIFSMLTSFYAFVAGLIGFGIQRLLLSID